MTDNPVKAIGHLPPKRIAVVVAVGIGAGLLLRKFKGGSKTPTAQQTADATGVDLSGLALAGSSTGNLGASGGGGGTTSGIADDDGTTRQVGSITLPVVKWVVTIGGEQFLTDGTNLERIGGGNVVVPVTPKPPPPLYVGTVKADGVTAYDGIVYPAGTLLTFDSMGRLIKAQPPQQQQQAASLVKSGNTGFTGGGTPGQPRR